MNRTVCNDNDFGPVVHNCRNEFDFTLLFENTILSIIPSLLAVLFATGRVFYLRRKPKLLYARRFQLLKLVCDNSPRPPVVSYLTGETDCSNPLCDGAKCVSCIMVSPTGSAVVVFNHGSYFILAEYVFSLLTFLS